MPLIIHIGGEAGTFPEDGKGASLLTLRKSQSSAPANQPLKKMRDCASSNKAEAFSRNSGSDLSRTAAARTGFFRSHSPVH